MVHGHETSYHAQPGDFLVAILIWDTPLYKCCMTISPVANIVEFQAAASHALRGS